MNNLIRRNPYREMMSLRNAMDRLFDDAFVGPQWEWQPFSAELALDVAEENDTFVVKASLPGINPDDLDITFTGRTLTIKGEFKAEEEKSDVKFHMRERRYGSFSRSVTLPTPINADAIEAKYDAGVLTLRLPKTEDVKPKRIAISAGEPQRMIEGKAADITGKN